MNKKDEIIELLKENKQQVTIVLAGIVLTIILKIIGGFLGLLSDLILIATIGYALFVCAGVLDKKKAAQKAKVEADKKAKREAAINAFISNIDINEEIDEIFTVIDKDQPTVKTFEQGIDNLLKTYAPSLDKNDIRPIIQDTLLKRIINGVEQGTPDKAATAILSNYVGAVMRTILTGDYIFVVQADSHINGASNSTEAQIWLESSKKHRISFIKNLYGFAVRAWNYTFCLENNCVHAPIDEKLLNKLIENDAVLKSYCEENPFESDKIKKEWIQDLSVAGYKIANTNGLKLNVEGNEKALDMLCYISYNNITNSESNNIDSIVSDILEAIKPYCEEIVYRTK